MLAGAAFAVPCPKLVSPRTRDTPQIVPFRSPERSPMPAGASNVSQNASGDVADCRIQVPWAVAEPDSAHHAITPNAAVVIATTRVRTIAPWASKSHADGSVGDSGCVSSWDVT